MFFKIYDETNAPEESKKSLEGAKKAFGMVPNLLGTLAESPATLETYMQLSGQLEKTSFSPQEIQVMYLAINRENECHYCMAAHTALAKQAKVPEHVIESLREGKEIDEPKLNALASFTKDMVKERGWLKEDRIQKFLDAGYSKANVQEVVLAIAHKTISNYINHFNETEIDKPFQEFAWKK